MNTEHKQWLKLCFILLCKRLAEANQITEVAEKTEKWWKILDERYSESHRAYHLWEHIYACLKEFYGVIHLFDYSLAAEAAIFFHDIVYNIATSNNEVASAELLGEFLADFGWPDVVGKRLVCCTDHKSLSKENDEQLICDIDLAILGQPWPRYICYAQDIRNEYKSVPLDVYRTKRAEFLKTLMERERMFQTEYFRRKYAFIAESNMTAEMMALLHQRFPDH